MSNETKQTAVEWFFEQLTEVDYNLINKTFLQNNNSLAGYRLRELFEQAKEMEKEQMCLYIEKKWVQYRIFTNNEDAWSFKEWLIKQTYGGNK
jgi:hypothetical protein